MTAKITGPDEWTAAAPQTVLPGSLGDIDMYSKNMKI